jgi:predicted branched-subunit amino acid permease
MRKSHKIDDASRAAIRMGVGIGVTTGAYGLSFGAIAVAAGLTPLQASVLSLAMFTGGSQFAFVGVVAGGGAPMAGAVSAGFLGLRNAFYGLRLTPLLLLRGWRRIAGAQLVIDESTAVAVSRPDPGAGRVGFWVTGLTVFVLWNAGTLIGAVGAQAIAGPKVLGFDAAVPAAFVALLAPMVTTRRQVVVAILGAALALATLPLLPIGFPVLIVAIAVIIVGARIPPEESKP